MIRRGFLKLCSAFTVVATLMAADTRAFAVTCEKRDVRRWTMKPSIREGELCRMIGWTDEYGNIHVAIHDAYTNPNFSRCEAWMVRPPKEQMKFKEWPKGAEWQFEPASAYYPGSDRRETTLVNPEHLMALTIPEDFEALWERAVRITNTDEGAALFAHYLRGQ